MSTRLNKSKRVVFVTCRKISEHNRVACAMHSSLEQTAEPDYALVPIRRKTAKKIKAFAVVYEDGNSEVFLPDELSQAYVE